MRLTSANVIPETVESTASAATSDTWESSDEGNREIYVGGEEGLQQWGSSGFSLRKWAENIEQGHRLVTHWPSGGTFLLWLESLNLDTQGSAVNSGFDLLGSMQLHLLHSAGAGEALTKILEVRPLLNELQRDAVLGGDSGGRSAPLTPPATAPPAIAS